MAADKSIFGYDPIIGCPFDDSEMKMVEEWHGFRVGMRVGVQKFPCGTICGEIMAIGENAKYFDGESFVAFAVKTTDSTQFKTDKEVQFID